MAAQGESPLAATTLATGALLFSFDTVSAKQPWLAGASSALGSEVRECSEGREGHEAFGASPKSERKRVVLDDGMTLPFNDAKRTPPTSADDGATASSSAGLHRELSISTGLKTLLKVPSAE